jgi:hypothetical protein
VLPCHDLLGAAKKFIDRERFARGRRIGKQKLVELVESFSSLNLM